MPIAGVAPTEATIADLSYPGAASSTSTSRASTCRPSPSSSDFVAAYAKVWGKGGPLEKRGLVPFGGADATAATAQATALKPLDPAA